MVFHSTCGALQEAAMRLGPSQPQMRVRAGGQRRGQQGVLPSLHLQAELGVRAA